MTYSTATAPATSHMHVANAGQVHFGYTQTGTRKATECGTSPRGYYRETTAAITCDKCAKLAVRHNWTVN